MPGSTAVIAYDGGASYAERLDAGRGADANGFKLSALYFPGTSSCGEEGEGGGEAERARGGELALRLLPRVGATTPTTAPTLIAAKRDRLVLFRSARVLSAMRPCVGRGPAFRVAFWMHGASGDGGGEGEEG
jgi:hypothetical protein